MSNEDETPSLPEDRISQISFRDTQFYRHSEVKFISNVDTFFLLVKSTIGTGLFAMPYAFSRVGLIFGIVSIVGIGFLITISLQLFLRIYSTTCTRLGKSTVMYDEIVEVALKSMDTKIPKLFIHLATYFTNALQVFYYIGVGSICVDFIGDVIRQILKFDESMNPARYTSVFLPFFMMLNLSKYLRDISLKAIAGNILILNVIIISSFRAFEKNTAENWTLLNTEYLWYPRSIGIIIYSLSSPGLVLVIKQSTDNAESNKFNKVLEHGMILIIFVHLIVGVVGYLKWGSNVSENFLRDIRPDSKGYIVLAFIMQALAIYLTYGLQCYVPISIFLKQYAVPAIDYGACKGTLYLWELIVRFAVTLVSCLLPMLIPRLRLRVALLGLTCNVTLTFLLPLTLHVLDLLKNLPETKKPNWKVITGISCIVFTTILTLCCFFLDLILSFKHA